MVKVRRGIIFTGMVCLAACLAPQSYAAADSPEIMIDHHIVQFPDAKPFIDENGRTQVPVRFVADQLGFQVNWKRENGAVKVILTKDAKLIVLKEGETAATINGQPISLDSSVMIRNDRTFVPIRFVAESVGKYVQWDENRNTVSISSDKPVMMADATPTPLKPATRSLNDEKKPSITSQVSKTLSCVATAYGPSDSTGLTATGKPVAQGMIAVDPNVIPLGSKVWISGYNDPNLPAGGFMATAEDTGGAIRGNRIDIYINADDATVRRFGVQQVTVQVLK
jgi:3D (Asp-Asp-Asp) domain-containing protein